MSLRYWKTDDTVTSLAIAAFPFPHRTMEQEPPVHLSQRGYVADLFKRVMRYTRLSL